jgi:hypothetical protein
MWRYAVGAAIVALLALWAADLFFVFDPRFPVPVGAR